MLEISAAAAAAAAEWLSGLVLQKTECSTWLEWREYMPPAYDTWHSVLCLL